MTKKPKTRQQLDRRPGKEILRELMDALADDPMCAEEGEKSPLELMTDILSRQCPPGCEAGALCYDKTELGVNTCWECWYKWLEEGA